jgi:hypothetical protein
MATHEQDPLGPDPSAHYLESLARGFGGLPGGISGANVRPDPAENQTAISGYGRLSNDTPALDEMFNDALRDRALQMIRYRGKFIYSYTGLDGIGDAIVREVARRRGRHPQEVEDMLLRGKLNGDRAGLQLVEDTLGTPAMHRLRRLKGDETKEQLLRLAHEIGLGELAAVDDWFRWRR